MMHAVRGLGLAVSLSLVSTVALAPLAEAQSTTAAHVYIQTKGSAGAVYGFSASSTGKLSSISGSPFKPAGLPVGGTKSKFFTMGNTLIHSYGIASNGAIGAQIAQMPVFDYAGGSCGSDTGGVDQPQAVLDHTGNYMYVLLQYGGDWSCAAYQTYKINSDGAFSFDGDTEENWGSQSGQVNPASVGAPAIMGNETFAYAEEWIGHNSGPIAFRRESSGTLEGINITEKDPVLDGGGDYYIVQAADPSPTGNYVVFKLYCCGLIPPHLASYTVASNGNISTTNTQSSMPTSSLYASQSTFSPSGNLFVLYAGGSGVGDGIEIYKFNGAAPLTLYKTLLTGTSIDQVAWDSSNHIYAISTQTNKLYVFTVTSTSVTEDSSISIGSPWDMVVVSE